MLSSRGGQKFGRVTVTLVPTSDDRSFRSVPSTFSATDSLLPVAKGAVDELHDSARSGSQAQESRSTCSSTPAKKGRSQAKDVQKVVQDLVKSKIESEWKGLKFGGIGRAGSAVPPQKALVRGSIEDILGVAFDR